MKKITKYQKTNKIAKSSSLLFIFLKKKLLLHCIFFSLELQQRSCKTHLMHSFVDLGEKKGGSRATVFGIVGDVIVVVILVFFVR